MHPIVENFLERPMSHKLGFCGLSLVVVGLLFWQFFYSSKLTEFQELSDGIEKIRTEIATEKRLARDLGKFREQVKQLDIKLKFVLQELPDKREIPDFLNSISNLAREAGLEVHLFRPMGERAREFFAEVPVAVSVEGTFHQITTFFDEVSRLPRIVNINEISIREPRVTDELVSVKSDCVATTFRYLDESERRAAKDADQNKKRKRR